MNKFFVVLGKSIMQTAFATKADAQAYLDNIDLLDRRNGMIPRDGNRRLILHGIDVIEVQFSIRGTWIKADLV